MDAPLPPRKSRDASGGGGKSSPSASHRHAVTPSTSPAPEPAFPTPPPARYPSRVLRILLALLLSLSLASCTERNEVVLYTSIDEPVARDVIRRFQMQTGVRVVLVTDTEATKTAGLAERVLAERDRPRADVYWGNEPFHTIRLADAGVLAPHPVAAASDIPTAFRDPADRWVGVGYRARVICLSAREDLSPLIRDITRLEHLTRPDLRGRIALAVPSTGTTAGHMAALYTLWGEEKYRGWLIGLRANQAKLLGGNSVVAQLTGQGTLVAGLTDNDDVDATRATGLSLTELLPDQAEGELGTLLVPTTLALVTGGPNPDNAKRLLEFLASRPNEDELIRSRFLRGSLRTLTTDHVRAMTVDLPTAARNMRTATELALTILQDRPPTPTPSTTPPRAAPATRP